MIKVGQVRLTESPICPISDAVRWAEEIVKQIDKRWPTR